MFGIAKRKMLIVAAALGSAAFTTSRNSAFGFVGSLTDNNSTLSYSSATNATSWVVDGVDQFGGTPAGGDLLQYFNGTSYAPLSDLTVVTPPVLSGNIGSVTLGGTLDGDNFTVAIKAILVGGSAGSGASAINETITVSNLGPTPPQVPLPAPPPAVPVDFFISDTFDANLNATPNNDTLTLSPSGSPNKAVQTDPAGVKLTYVTTLTPSAFELINNGTSSATAGPETGNEAFQFIWDLSLAPGDTGIISNTISLSGADTTVPGVPLPNSAASALATLAGLGIVGVLRRKHAAV
jgi:hypothetical protein